MEGRPYPPVWDNDGGRRALAHAHNAIPAWPVASHACSPCTVHASAPTWRSTPSPARCSKDSRSTTAPWSTVQRRGSRDYTDSTTSSMRSCGEDTPAPYMLGSRGHSPVTHGRGSTGWSARSVLRRFRVRLRTARRRTTLRGHQRARELWVGGRGGLDVWNRSLRAWFDPFCAPERG